ncbi:MAG: FtsW/RodA/SpoVE family cell cycle protein, partial [Limibacillus sp.]
MAETKITFELNGETVEAAAGETIWQVAQRQGVEIPHLCYQPEPGYRADGNCRACMVEIEGERVLAASCIREPAEGMKVKTASERAKKARDMVFELLVADQPKREVAHDPESKFWHWAADMGVTESRFPKAEGSVIDNSHPAMAVNLDACIHCNLCVRACREVQVNDVIGMAYRGSKAQIIFDFDSAMGESTCVACGECVQACPTGALMEANLLDETGKRSVYSDKTVDSLCHYCGVGCQTTVHVKDDKVVQVDGRNGPANENRLCVKGRFGFDYIHNPNRLTKPLIRREDAPKAWDDKVADGNPLTHFREASWEEALERATAGLKKVYEEHGPKGIAGFGSARWFQVGVITIQPSELAKILITLVLADYLSRNQYRIHEAGTLIRSLILVVVPALLVFVQPDLSTAIVLGVIWLALVWAAGVHPKHLVTLALGVIAAPLLAWPLLQDYQKLRVINFLFPDPEAGFGATYNVNQALIAIGSGGLYGQGYSSGTQVQLRFLKVRHTDFIF